MLIHGVRKLERFWSGDPNAEKSLRQRVRDVEQRDWRDPHELLEYFPRASILPANRAVFRIRGNRYQLVVHVDYFRSNVTVLFVGTHSDYDAIDASRI